MVGCALMLLTLFFSTLYAYIIAGLEKNSAERIKALTSYSAALVEDRLSSYVEAVQLVSGFAAASSDRLHTFSGITMTDANNPLEAHAILFIKGQGLFLFDLEGCRAVSPEEPFYSNWLEILSQSEAGVNMAGPFPGMHGGNEQEILFTRTLTSHDGLNIGALALCVPLTNIAEKLWSVSALSAGGRKFYLVGQNGQVLLPLTVNGTILSVDEVPLLQTLPSGPLSDARTLVRHTHAGIEYIAAKARIGKTAWELFIFSPSEHELRLQPLLLWAFGGAWACLCLFIVLLLYLARQQDHYKVLSELDHLTGAGNRLAFEKALELSRKQQQYPICLIVMDVDGLKILNDSLGHQAGDGLLRRVTLLLQRSLRENDVIYRIGGDEFAVILPGASYSVAQPLTERINVQAALMREKTGLPPIYISHGLAEARDAESFTTLFTRADAAMYGNKNLRREAAHRAIMKWVREHPEHGDRRAKPTP